MVKTWLTQHRVRTYLLRRLCSVDIHSSPICASVFVKLQSHWTYDETKQVCLMRRSIPLTSKDVDKHRIICVHVTVTWKIVSSLGHWRHNKMGDPFRHIYEQNRHELVCEHDKHCDIRTPDKNVFSDSLQCQWDDSLRSCVYVHWNMDEWNSTRTQVRVSVVGIGSRIQMGVWGREHMTRRRWGVWGWEGQDSEIRWCWTYRRTLLICGLSPLREAESRRRVLRIEEDKCVFVERQNMVPVLCTTQY